MSKPVFELGEEVVIWGLVHDQEAYEDQFGRKHPGRLLIEEHRTNVVKILPKKGSYDKEQTFYDFLLRSKDDNYFRSMFDEVSGSPYSIWMPSGGDADWIQSKSQIVINNEPRFIDHYEVCQLRNEPIVKDNQPAKLPTGYSKCKTHRYIFRDEKGCIICKLSKAN